MPGLLVSIVMLGTLTWTIIEAPDRGWHSLATITGFAVSALALVVFIVRERRRRTRCWT